MDFEDDYHIPDNSRSPQHMQHSPPIERGQTLVNSTNTPNPAAGGYTRSNSGSHPVLHGENALVNNATSLPKFPETAYLANQHQYGKPMGNPSSQPSYFSEKQRGGQFSNSSIVHTTFDAKTSVGLVGLIGSIIKRAKRWELFLRCVQIACCAIAFGTMLSTNFTSGPTEINKVARSPRVNFYTGHMLIAMVEAPIAILYWTVKVNPESCWRYFMISWVRARAKIIFFFVDFIVAVFGFAAWVALVSNETCPEDESMSWCSTFLASLSFGFVAVLAIILLASMRQYVFLKKLKLYEQLLKSVDGQRQMVAEISEEVSELSFDRTRHRA
ncbi:hypothetical protein GQ42DRAFT_159769 [Ramicandelaber brevisporus]|nr:hypothetical protein GQ42DRAFT_159769 [Ramicandelaber brevisporus]